jgi:hypothetical protein
MKDPMPINLMTSEEVRASGWQAESRDADGHLLATHAPFGDDDEGIVWFVRETTSRGETVTIWPPKVQS